MSTPTATSRRSFLKTGAMVAVPVAAIGMPAAALAQDGSKAALARLQDERAIEALGHDFVRAFNRGGAQATASLFADRTAPAMAKGVSKLSFAERPQSLAIAADGATASARYDCAVDLAEELEGRETIFQMARLQGNSALVLSTHKTLSASYARHPDGWRITSIDLT